MVIWPVDGFCIILFSLAWSHLFSLFFGNFMLEQAASSGKYIDPCLDMLIRNFIPPYSYLALLKQPRGLSRKHQGLSRVHSALESISHLVPLAPMRLLSLVIQRMPRQNDNEAVSSVSFGLLMLTNTTKLGCFLIFMEAVTWLIGSSCINYFD